MHEGTPKPIPSEERTWPGKEQGLPPPATSEFGIPTVSGNDNHEKTWPGKEDGLPPPLTPEFMMSSAGTSQIVPAEPPPPRPVFESSKINALQERTIENPELLEGKEASKKFLQEERNRLAQEIRAERKAQREKLGELRSEALKLSIELQAGKVQLEEALETYSTLSEKRAQVADSLAGRVRSLITNTTGFTFLSDKALSDDLTAQESAIEAQRAKTEEFEADVAALNELIDSDQTRTQIKQKLDEHYAEAAVAGSEVFEGAQRAVEQTMLRNNAFIVHTILDEKHPLRHNENSNVSKETSQDDDTDILLAFEPTISTSSVRPGYSENGSHDGLWGEGGGFLIAGGDVRFAHETDMDTVSDGLKNRVITRKELSHIHKQSLDDIDRAVSRRPGARMETYNGRYEVGSEYNELVVDNPKIFGYFQQVDVSPSGKFQFKLSASQQFHSVSEQVEYYVRQFDSAQARGLKLLVMTPERRVYELFRVNANGIIEVGKEVTPEEVAQGNAGVSSEVRKRVGNELLKRSIFRDEETQSEARQIISELPER